ncbi:glutamine--fructose-6-phosphate transaminase (isomerizing) [Chlamydiales bacterium]|nr:glutamine--fructose-6-phosphate transaminase (isomerizing) [Chlamydiales bacterium]
MCGIYGYIGPHDAVKATLAGLKKLEYRGYDSSGIAGVQKGKIVYQKEIGKIEELEKSIPLNEWDIHLAIAQTRWATHGKPTKENAHPHVDQMEQLAVVHNGIIENHDELRNALKKQGVSFVSETDTEVLAHLIASFYEGDILKAVQQTLPLLEGSFAVSLVHREAQDQIIAFANEAPLAIGVGREESFISSDANAFGAKAKEVMYLGENEVAVIRAGSFEVFDENLVKIEKKTEEMIHQIEEISKGDFEHFTLKEIYDQPQAIRNVLFNRYLEDYGTANLEELSFDAHDLLSVERIVILGCGSSYHAGLLAACMFQDLARIPTTVEISSEYRYSDPIVSPKTFVIAISQSGETADTLAAVRELKAKGAKILSLVNTHGSTLSRESDSTLYLRAGVEVGVCSTKAFSNQVVLLSLFALLMARTRHLTKKEGQKFISGLKALPDQIEEVLNQSKHIQSLAKKYASYNNFFYLGRRYMYPTCLEGALKLKEISYINANAYPAGEMKHGPIALIDESCPTVAYLGNKRTLNKMVSNLEEVKARNGKVIAIAEVNAKQIQSIADDVIYIPEADDFFTCITSSVAGQLFAYYVAKERGASIDHPRNLAKSVTVE